MFRRVPVGRVVAAANMTARTADPKVDPTIARLQAFLAAERAWRYIMNAGKMGAGSRHGSAAPTGLGPVAATCGGLAPSCLHRRRGDRNRGALLVQANAIVLHNRICRLGHRNRFRFHQST
jgi:hypothetical protein